MPITVSPRTLSIHRVGCAGYDGASATMYYQIARVPLLLLSMIGIGFPVSVANVDPGSLDNFPSGPTRSQSSPGPSPPPSHIAHTPGDAPPHTQPKNHTLRHQKDTMKKVISSYYPASSPSTSSSYVSSHGTRSSHDFLYFNSEALDSIFKENPGIRPPPLSNESKLIHYLLFRLHQFGMYSRPVLESSRPVQVDFRMTLVQILDFDETKQLLITNVWKAYQWIDEVLTWRPEDFGGIKDLRLPPHVVWTPDIVLYNKVSFSADETYEREQHHELIAIFSNGTVKWIPSAIYKSSCPVDMTNFPFDIQTCHFKFGSWTYDGLKLNLKFLENETLIDMEEYMLSSEWDILKQSGYRRERQYPCCGEDPYPELIYTITIKRRTAFYIVVLILPCVLLSCLTVSMFWFPPQRPDRTGLGMSLFSSFFVLLLILVQASPPTAHSISLLGVYYCINMILIAMSTLICAVVINMCKHKGTMVRVPSFLLKLHKQTWFHFLMRAQGVMVQQKYTKDGRKVTPQRGNGQIQMDEQGRAVMDWAVAAVIVDRVCFIIYLIAFLFSLIFVFPR